MNKKIITLNVYTNCSDISDLNHDYDIIKDNKDSLVEMYRSNDESWTNPKQKIITCKENDTEGTLTIKIGNKKPITLSYCEAYELFVLFGIVFEKDRIEYRQSTVIKSIVPV